MKEKKKYTTSSNVSFILKKLIGMYKSIAIILPVMIITGVLTDSIVALIPSRAVYVLENGLGLKSLILQVGGIILIHIAIRILHSCLTYSYSAKGTAARCYGFIGDMVIKSLTTDYYNRECNENQQLIGKANNSINSNYVGIELVITSVPNVVINFLGLILFGGGIIWVDYRILLVLLLMLVCNTFANRYARNYLVKCEDKNSKIWSGFSNIQNRSQDIVCGKDIRIYKMEKWFGDLMQSYIDMGKQYQKGVEKHFYLPVFSDTIFIAIRDGLAYAILIHKVLHGDISLTGFSLMLGVIAGFSNWMFNFVNSVMDLLKADKSVVYYREVLDMEDSFLHGMGEKVSETMLGTAPEIEFRNVTFSYEEGKNILSNINLKIRAGEKLALVGGNGEGKTTLVKLLCGFYHPTSGQILVNGIDIEKYDIEEYFKLVGVVFQDVNPLPFRIVSIVSGHKKEDTDMDRFWRAVKAAGLKEKIEGLEKREETFISPELDENGIKLSGGEVQKLVLARCIYKDAPLLILDEPTSALDPIAESEMYEQYNSLTKNKTSIFISHRLASTRFCDRIIFLENGTIAEQGTHDELIMKNGRYAKIYDVQSHYYKNSDEGNYKMEMEAAYE